MTLADRVLQALGEAGPRGLDDDELARRLGVVRQAVNQVCRRMATEGRISRGGAVGGKITNRLRGAGTPGSEPASPPDRPTPSKRDGLLSEDEVKAAILAYLEADGWKVAVAWGHQRGADIDARRGDERLVLEAKGEAALQPQQVNYFLGALGELIQRMDDRGASYGLALPDNRQYRGLISRLPAAAVERLGLVVYLVEREGESYRVEQV